jgi:cytochrome c peroxidase
MRVLFSLLIVFGVACFSANSFSVEKVGTPLWSDAEKKILRSLSLAALKPLPVDKSNRYGNNKKAQLLGQKLFFDKRLSANGEVSCASCHQPQNFFTDQRARGVGLGVTHRNTPTVVGSGWLKWFYWDGRRDSLWSQALIPLEAPDEMGSDRVAIIRTIFQDKTYYQLYQSIFGAFPKKLDLSLLPEHAGPLGDKKKQNKWYKLPVSTRKEINTIYSDIGKALAAYQRTLIYKKTRFDQYVEQLETGNSKTVSLSENEVAGIKLFIDATKTQCLQCHNGPLLTNGGFHNVGSGNFSGPVLDFGRVFGIQAVLMDEFNCLGQYSDAKPSDCAQLRFLNKSHHIPLKGSYKTPSLRNLSVTAPYYHDGRFNTLLEVIKYYNEPPTNNGLHELKSPDLSAKEQSQLVAFLNMLNENK